VIAVLSVLVASHRDELLEVARELRPVTRERDALDQHPVHGARKAPQPGADLEPPDPQVEVAPGRVDRALIMAVRRLKLAPRADEPAPPERHPGDHEPRLELDRLDPHAIQTQEPRECRADAHRCPFLLAA